MGMLALGANTTGDNSTAFGHYALAANTTGVNTAIGQSVLSGNTTGTYNVGVGGYGGSAQTLVSNTTGSYNIAVGMSALGSNTTASNNIAIGYQALFSNTTGANNVAIGHQSLISVTTNGGNVATGFWSLYNNTAANNTAYGYYSMFSNTTGTGNAAFGGNVTGGALRSNTTGNYNTALGADALQSNTTASNNTAVGYQAGYSNTTGAFNTMLGYQAGYGVTNYGANTFIGYQAGLSATTNSSYNTFIGKGAGSLVTTGSVNTILGAYNGNQGGLDIRTASNYIVLSDGDGNPRVVTDNNGWTIINPTTSNATNLGGCALSVYGTNTSSGNQMFAMRNTGATAGKFWYQAVSSANTVFYLNNSSVGVQITDGATSWSSYSDARLKNVKGTFANALADLNQLEPVKFTWKTDIDNKPCVGVIAQSVAKVLPEAIDFSKLPNAEEIDDQTEYLSVRYTELIPLMIASIQELKAEFDAYKASHP
jgi:hypothetical protein